MENQNDNDQNLEINRTNDELERILNISLASQTVNNQQESAQRYCWVCFATDEEDESCNVEWVKPCRCKGTLRWVHQSCLQRWIDEKQKGNAFRRVECQQCKTEYIIVLPNMGLLADVLEAVDTLIRRSSPFIAAGVFVGSLYWTGNFIMQNFD
jgi:E3 ubiquitin-protein ligase MARCH5